jgi:general secretion pathway protein I
MCIKILSYKNQKPDTNCREPATGTRYPAPRIEPPETRNPHLGSRAPQRATRNPQHVSGFTLLEVLIAMAIMAIVLVSVYRLHSQTLSMATASRFYTQAPLLAQSKMAQLEATASDIVSGDSGDFGDQFPGYGWSVSTEDVSSEILGEAAEDLKRIDVTVTLNENEYEYTVRLYRLQSE